MTGLRRALFLACRAGFGLVFFLSSLYCLIAYNPFTYQQIIRFELLPWLTRFAHLQPWLYWPAQALAVATLAGELRARTRPGHWAALAYAAAALAAGVALDVHPILDHLENDRGSLLLGLLFLVPIVALAVIDHLAARAQPAFGPGDARHGHRLFTAALGAALFVFVTYSVLFALRVGPRAAALDGAVLLAVLASSLALHLVAFMALFLVLALTRGLAAFGKRRVGAELLLASGLAWVVLSFLVRSRVLAALSMTGSAATLISVALAGAVVVSLSGLAVRICADPGGVASGVDVLMAALAIAPRARSRVVPFVGLALLAGAAGVLAAMSATLDWNGLVAQVSALAVWTVAFATLLAHRPRQAPEPAAPLDGPALALVAVALLVLGGQRWLSARCDAMTDPASDPPIDVRAALTRYAGFEPSFRVLHDLLGARASDDGALFELLQASTNMGHDAHVEPTDVVLAPGLRATPGPKPNIFIVVVDSLRRDYLSPYNRDVHFTPGVARFAADSHVFENAFTHYGATGLSEPSIWVGGMLPHKQYVTPFRPFNALEKLLEAEEYDRFVSVDTILSVVLDGAPGIVPLDAGVSNADYDLCRSLDELEGKLDARGDPSRPVFAYTQPQNLHVSRIEREGKTVPPGFEAPGFYLPYASRLARIDACFGGFIEYLAARKMLDNSVVVLTADHGDSLGEEGRWGHAYTIYPEIIRIPLIMHVPPALAAKVTTEHARTVFSTDITPTLYALLGHPPDVTSDVFGRPLFWPERAGPAPRERPWQLIVSSYGPVYGILDDARHLFIADGVNYTESSYDATAGLVGARLELSGEDGTEAERRIQAAVTALHAFYRVPDAR